MSSLSKPREAALKALVATQKDGAYLNIALRDILHDSNMDSRDCALATTLVTGVMKNILFIDNIIANISSVKPKKLSVWIYNILRIGIFSIRFLDRIPDSATVNECVRLARRYGHSSSAGFVNAVLRKSAGCGDFLPKDEKSDEYISIKYSLPLWLVKMWRSEGYGEEFFASMNLTPPVTVRLNTLKCDSLGEGFEKIPSLPHGYTYTGGGSVEATDLYKSGFIAVQDGASQTAVSKMNISGGMRILDLCSAPGGKSAYISQLLENSGEVIAADIHEHKLELIKNNLSRLGVKNVKVILNDATVLREEFKDSFDRVLADVPCSGLGVLRRKPDIRLNKSPLLNEELVKVQRRILKNASQYVRKGGLLIYSTCTVSRSENEDAVRDFLSEHSDFLLIEEKQLLPHIDNTDGFFYAVLERK